MKRKGETLIDIPWWWEGDLESLKSTIHFYRPDLLSHSLTLPVSLNPFPFIDGNVPDVGNVMLASFPPSVSFTESISPLNPWWLGEKYDGVRCCWNPLRGTLFSRTGVVIGVPSDYLSSQFPSSSFIDGEIWFGRGNFPIAQAYMKSPDVIEYLAFFRILAFDDPSFDRVLCISLYFLSHSISLILSDGGEGLVMQAPHSPYNNGRSDYLFKIKAARGDKEALVVELRNSSLILQLPDGVTFEVEGDQVASLQPRPKKGAIVTFAYDNYTQGCAPVNPKLVRLREDVSWDDVINDHLSQSPRPLILNEISKGMVGSKGPRQLRKSYSQQSFSKRYFFEKFAQSRGMDPLLANNWYSISPLDINNFKITSQLYHHGMLIPSLMGVFQDIGLDVNKFHHLPHNYYGTETNRRKFFDDFAKNKQFDPLIPQNWYSVTSEHLTSHKGAIAVLKYYDSSFRKALLHLYPNIGLDVSKFDSVFRNHWKDLGNRRDFFEKTAKEMKINPLNAFDWYPISRDDISRHKGASAILHYYNGSLARALIHVFPEIGLQKSLFVYP